MSMGKKIKYLANGMVALAFGSVGMGAGELTQAVEGDLVDKREARDETVESDDGPAAT